MGAKIRLLELPISERINSSNFLTLLATNDQTLKVLGFKADARQPVTLVRSLNCVRTTLLEQNREANLMKEFKSLKFFNRKTNISFFISS